MAALPAAWGSVKEILEDISRSCSPDLIIAPSSDDAHQDHRTIGELIPTVFCDQLYLAYEIAKEGSASSAEADGQVIQ